LAQCCWRRGRPGPSSSSPACIAGLALFSEPLPLPQDHALGIFSLYVQGMLICFMLDAALLVVFITRITQNMRSSAAKLADLRQRAAEEEHIVRMGLLASGAAHELGTPLATLAVILGDWKRMPEFKGNRNCWKKSPKCRRSSSAASPSSAASCCRPARRAANRRPPPPSTPSSTKWWRSGASAARW
jgi:hypothetical protein